MVLDLCHKISAIKYISFHTEPINSRILFKNIKLCRTIILSVLLGCENWSVTVREKYRLRDFERHRVVRKVCEHKDEGVAGGAGKMHNKLLLLASLCYGGFWVVLGC